MQGFQLTTALRVRVFEHLKAREESLAVQSILVTIARLCGVIATFIVPVVLVRVLTPAAFGVYKQLLLVATTLIPILTFGFSASLHYFIPRDPAGGQQYVVSALRTLFGTGLLAAVLIVGFPSVIGSVLNSAEVTSHLWILAGYIWLSLPGEMVSTLPVVDRRPALAAWVIGGSEILRGMLVLGAVLLWSRVSVVIGALVLFALLRAAFLYIYVRRRGRGLYHQADFAVFGAQFRYSLPLALGVLLQVGITTFHEYFVAARVTDAEFAIYALGVMNVPLFGLLVFSLADVVLVRASTLFSHGDTEGLQRLWHTALARLAAVVLPLWLVLELFAGDIFLGLFGPAYTDAVPVFRIFLIGSLLLVVVDHAILRATADTTAIIVANIGGLLACVLSVLFFARWSITLGAAIGYVVGIAVARGYGLLTVVARLNLSLVDALPWRDFAKITAAGLFASFAIVPALLFGAGFPRLLVGSSLFILIYAACAVRFGAVKLSELQHLVRKVTGTGVPGRTA